MEFIPIPYFGMILSLFVLPAMTFGFITINKKIKADVEIVRLKKEMLELEYKKEQAHLNLLAQENIKYDKIIEEGENGTSKY